MDGIWRAKLIVETQLGLSCWTAGAFSTILSDDERSLSLVGDSRNRRRAWFDARNTVFHAGLVSRGHSCECHGKESYHTANRVSCLLPSDYAIAGVHVECRRGDQPRQGSSQWAGWLEMHPWRPNQPVAIRSLRYRGNVSFLGQMVPRQHWRDP